MKIKTKGALLCLISTACIATAGVVTKLLLQNTNFLMLSLLWYFFAFCWFCTGAILRRENPLAWLTLHWKKGLILGSLNYLAGITWFYVIDKLGPSTTGFLQRFETVVLLLLGLAVLHEHLSRNEIIGMVISFAGGIILTFSLEKTLWFAMAFAVLLVISNGLQNFVAKLFVKDISPYQLGTLRVFYTSLLLLPTVILLHQFVFFTVAQLPWLLIGTLISPFLGYLAFFSSLRHIEAAQAAIYINTQPFFVVLYAILLLSVFPTLNQIIGGILIVAGIAIVMVRNLGLQGQQRVGVKTKRN